MTAARWGIYVPGDGIRQYRTYRTEGAATQAMVRDAGTLAKAKAKGWRVVRVKIVEAGS